VQYIHKKGANHSLLSDLPPFLFQKVIEAPGAGAGGRKIEEIETKDHGDLTEVVDREKASRKMRAEISHRHFAGNNECCRASEQADQNQKSTHHFDHAGDTEQRKIRETRIRLARRIAEKLLRSMLKEKESGYNSQDAEQVWRPFRGHRSEDATVLIWLSQSANISRIHPAKLWRGEKMQTKFLRVLTVLVVLAALAMVWSAPGIAQGGGQGGGQGRGRGPQTPPLIMTSPAWEDGGVIPDKYTQKGGQMGPSPELKWTQVPPGTQSFVLLLHDPEPVLNKGSKMDITHWLIWNIPGTSTGLAEGVSQGELPDGSRQVSLRGNGYMGPGAPAGPYHHYTFELYALDTKLDVPQGTPQQAADTRTAVINAMDGHVLGKAVLVARFHQ
jgi:Raf kinase inhibitor-like YbhB/YbcL family protein